MSQVDSGIRVPVDLANPGQFLACCGLLELADRLWPGAEASFEGQTFRIADGRLAELLAELRVAALFPVDADDPMTSPLDLSAPFHLRLDWWLDSRSGGDAFKTWSGQQKVVQIARAMHATIDPELAPEDLLNTSAVLFDPAEKKVEPFYFDARRSSQSHGLDIGFSPDAQGMTMPVYASVEFLCLIGLQRFRPVASTSRTFEYTAWNYPIPASVAPALAAGAVSVVPSQRFSFRLLFRTKYSKGFLSANQIGG